MRKLERAVKRETNTLVDTGRAKGRLLCWRAEAGQLIIWPKGMRREKYSIGWLAVFHRAAEIQEANDRKERRRRRRERTV